MRGLYGQPCWTEPPDKPPNCGPHSSPEDETHRAAITTCSSVGANRPLLSHPSFSTDVEDKHSCQRIDHLLHLSGLSPEKHENNDQGSDD
ncbi:hypothetical protein GCM10009733_078410 [Nonomuraea maheshkhaliensis]|uniref:Uncharacterized protein n=1 Tax=Nonomuraea maheshkhaliensis TaxID=419590 RepID=A0ABN2GD40_9ACTN